MVGHTATQCSNQQPVLLYTPSYYYSVVYYYHFSTIILGFPKLLRINRTVLQMEYLLLFAK